MEEEEETVILLQESDIRKGNQLDLWKPEAMSIPRAWREGLRLQRENKRGQDGGMVFSIITSHFLTYVPLLAKKDEIRERIFSWTCGQQLLSKTSSG